MLQLSKTKKDFVPKARWLTPILEICNRDKLGEKAMEMFKCFKKEAKLDGTLEHYIILLSVTKFLKNIKLRKEAKASNSSVTREKS